MRMASAANADTANTTAAIISAHADEAGEYLVM
jgi:hypothetical protein